MTSPVAGFRIAVRDISSLGVQLFMSDAANWMITTGSAMPAAPATKLMQDLISDYWSAINHRAGSSWVQGHGAGVILRSLGAISLLGMNRRSLIGLTNVTNFGATSNQLRVRMDTYSLADRIRPPFSVTSSVNLTGASSNFTTLPIDPPDDPVPAGYAETKMTPVSSALPTSIIGSWTNNYATERALSGVQTVRVHLCDVNNPSLIPSVTALLYQLASLSVTLVSPTYEAVVVAGSEGGYIFSFNFNASALASSTAAIELHLSTTTACDFIGIEMVFNHTGYLYDSGQLVFDSYDLIDFALPIDAALNGDYWIHIQPSDFCTYSTTLRSLVGGGTATAKYYTSIVGPGDPDGRFHAGRFLAADTATFPISNTAGWSIQSASSISLSRTRSGSLHGSRFPVEWTEADMLLPGGSLSRPMLSKIERILKSIGIMQYPTLLIPDPNMMEGVIERQNAPRWMMLATRTENHVGQMTGINNDVLADGSNHSFNRYDVQLHWVEHNGSKYGGGG